MFSHQAGRLLTHLGTLAAHPAAFAVVAVYAILWFIFERHSFDWQAVATLATWLMTLVIARSQYRDTQALQAKLDELLHAQGEARSTLATLDDEEPEDIERKRADLRQKPG